jgi:uncharacterized membrane protein (UPF0127 family)
MWRYPNLPRLRVKVDGRDTGLQAFRASGFVARLFGLLWRRPLERAEALWIKPCTSVHTLGMRYPIDVVFLDREGAVVGLRSALAPRRLAGARRARSVLELPANRSAELGIALGARVTLEAA